MDASGTQSARSLSEPAKIEVSCLRSLLKKLDSSLSRCRSETELFQQGHHIVVVVETGDLPLPDLHDLAEPQFARAPRGWKSARGKR